MSKGKWKKKPEAAPKVAKKPAEKPVKVAPPVAPTTEEPVKPQEVALDLKQAPDVQPAAQTARPYVCGTCSAPVNTSTAFCPRCGIKLNWAGLV